MQVKDLFGKTTRDCSLRLSKRLDVFQVQVVESKQRYGTTIKKSTMQRSTAGDNLSSHQISRCFGFICSLGFSRVVISEAYRLCL